MELQPPDAPLSISEAADELNRSERQVRRYLEAGKLKGSRSTGRWTLTALDVWRFKGIESEMLQNWRTYCIQLEARRENPNSEENIAKSDC